MKYIISEEQVKKFSEDKWCKYINEIIEAQNMKYLCGVHTKVVPYNFSGEEGNYYLSVVRLKKGYNDTNIKKKLQQIITDFLPHIESVVTTIDCNSPINI